MKKLFKILGFALLIYVFYFAFSSYPKLDLISGFSAKSVASGHFLDNRSLDLIQKTDNDIHLIDLAKNEINDAQKFVTSSVYGLKTRKAIYRQGLGATLINDNFDITKPYEIPKRSIISNNLTFPYGNLEPKDTVFGNIDYKKLKSAVDNSFDNSNQKLKKTRSILVIYNDNIIAEKYDSGFNKNSKILGWSMTKSLTATYFGILQKQGKININNSAPVVSWQKDSRKSITINDLLHMNSGLEWVENYNTICDATKMLFQESDMTQSQVNKQFVGKTNETWNYSSGTTNLLSGIIRNQFKTHQEYIDFWYSSLIDKIGMNSMIIEQDMSGNFVGSSYGWATTRDWAKFGLLYLHKGNWNGEQIFDPSWETYVRTPTNSSKGAYGAHFWLNANVFYKNAPKDMYSCSGYQGQKIMIFPSNNLVIVRMGTNEEEDKFDFNNLIAGVLLSIKKATD
ncbi:MAG: serine hydrolase [Flavobacterium sp.]|nr:serine hydrolase [Flavobacterium sp.]